MKNKKGFTLPEILIALTVIGIIAAITINIVSTNVRKAEIETKLKKAVSVLNSAIYRATLEYGPADQWPEIAKSQNFDAVATKYIAPNIMTLKPVEVMSLQDLGYKGNIKNPTGGNYSRMRSATKDFPRIILNDGTIFLSIFHISSQLEYVIDINGPKGPNVGGKDVFQLAIDTTRQVPFARMAGPKTNITRDPLTGRFLAEDQTKNINNYRDNQCKKQGIYCGWLIERNGWKVPNDYPHKL